MRPFGCPVTILNTLDSLCKFEGKVDEEFLVGYSVSSKAFRVFNSRTRIVQETLHVNFLENKPNNAGSGPTWLFNIDSLTRTMNYQPVTAGNQTNPNAQLQDKFDAEKAREKINQKYVIFPVWSSSSTNPHNYGGDAAFDGKEHDFDAKKPESDVILSPSSSAQSRKQDDKTKKEAKRKSHVESFTGYRDLSAEFEDCSDNNKLEDITYSEDENDVGTEADFKILETSITVSPIPTTRIHKDHLVSQIIGDLSSTTQTRSMTRVVKDQGGLSQMFNDDFHTFMFSSFLSHEEPKRIHQALKDPSWIEAMQEELLQFKMQKVWVLFDLPHGKRAIAYASFMGFMVYQMDVKSALLYRTIEEEVYVCQPPGFEDRDHHDKVYKVVKALYALHQAPRGWYETLANYLLENGFQIGKIDQTLFIKKQKGDTLLVQIYVDDIIFGATNKDLCKSFEKLMKDKFQMSSMGELTFFLGLQVKQKKNGIFINQDKYVAETLKKFGLTEEKPASTPIDTGKPLLKDPYGEDVDVHTYNSMIGLLMYLTSSRPDIMFAVNDVTRLQAQVNKKKLVVTEAAIREIEEEGDADEHVKDITAGDDAQGDDTAAHGEVPTVTQKPSIPSPTPIIPPSQPPQDIPSTSHEQQTPPQSPQALEITKLKRRVKELEKGNKDRVLNLEGCRRIIDEMDKDDAVVLMDEKEEDKKVEEAKVDESAQVQGRQAETQAEIYKIDMDHALKVLKVVTAASSETATAASAIISAAKPKVPVATITAAKVAAAPSRRRKGVLKAKEDPVVQRYQVIKRKLQTEAQARKNMMMYLKNVAGFKLDYFKGMSYDDIRPIFEAKFNSNIKFLLKTKEHMEEEKNKALQSINETPAQKAAKMRKLNKEVEDLKRHLEIMPDEDDDVYTESTPLARKVPVTDYEIIELNNKPYYKIIRADGTHQLYISFLTLLKNFNREDLEALWSLVKERFSTSKPKNFSDDFLLTTLGAMFEKPDTQAQV
nr:hypothetical protein [Tanacetum cinerariifolium]